MRTILSVIFILFLSLRLLTAQDVARLISIEICYCVDPIENIDSLYARLDRCFPKAIDTVFELFDEDMQELLSDEATLEKIINEMYDKLLSYCPKIKKFILDNKEKEFYKMSESERAREFYEAGIKAFESKDYKTAAKLYMKAIKADPWWVLAYDNLGLTYRTMGKYQKAVICYGKSLEIYPEGSYALQNQAVAFTYLNNFPGAQNNYDLMIYLYPDNPEGYFGTGKVSFLIQDYEKALDYTLSAHKMYISQKSDYMKDSEKLLSMIYEKLKEQKKDSLFFEKAKQFGINIMLNQTP